MTTMTLSAALARHNITAADDALAEIEVPVLIGPQRQGDVGIFPRARLGAAERKTMLPVGRKGVAVVRGESGGNTHLLDAVQGVVLWAANPNAGPTDLTLGILHVEDGALAHLLHTDEHGCNAIGPGTYRLTGKREQADEIRRVAD